MDLRVLRYFLAVANEGSITRAADALYVTQPTVSKQILELERELGVELFVRKKSRLLLTEDGLLLQKRALEIVRMVDATEAELRHEEQEIRGDVFLGTSEGSMLYLISEVVQKLQETHPKLSLHFLYGDAYSSLDRLERGLIDFAILNDQTNDRNHCLALPSQDTWGLVVSASHPLASQKVIRPMDLRKIKLMVTRQTSESNSFEGWLGYSKSRLNIIGTFDIANLVLPLVESGICCCIMMDRAWLHPSSTLRFIPLEPQLRFSGSLYWSRTRPLSAPCQVFLDTLKSLISAETSDE